MEKQEKRSESSENHHKKRKILSYICIGILAIVLIFFVVIYLSVPSYRFEDPKAFSGKFIYNPYQDTCYNWKYINFRDKSLETNDINVYEYGYGIFPTRYLCIDCQSERKIDYPFFQNIHFKQYNINCLSEKCGLVVPAHPSKGFKLREMKHLDNYRVMEVISPYGNDFNYWELALSSGRRVNILATSSDENSDGFVYENVVNHRLDDDKYYINSLKKGDSYAISYKKDNEDIPQLKSLILKNDTVIVEASETIAELRFIGQNGAVKDSLYSVNQGVYVFKDDDSYIRAELRFDDETTIYLNPLVRHEFQYFFDPALLSMMKEKTWLMRFVYIFAAIFFVKYLLFNKKEEK